jgi:hypothetical protein
VCVFEKRRLPVCTPARTPVRTPVRRAGMMRVVHIGGGHSIGHSIGHGAGRSICAPPTALEVFVADVASD